MLVLGVGLALLALGGLAAVRLSWRTAVRALVVLLAALLLPAVAAAQSITTCEEVFQVMFTRTLDEADSELGRRAGTALAVECLAQRYGPRWANRGYLHQSDHQAALRVLMEREPTYLEVFDSWIILGSRNIDLARQKAGYDVTGKPTGFDGWNEDQQRLAVYVKLYGASRGSRILDGKDRDPDPGKAAELLALWRGVEVPIPEPPPDPEPEPPPPTPPPTECPPPVCRCEAQVTRATGEAIGATVLCLPVPR